MENGPDEGRFVLKHQAVVLQLQVLEEMVERGHDQKAQAVNGCRGEHHQDSTLPPGKRMDIRQNLVRSDGSRNAVFRQAVLPDRIVVASLRL